MDIRQMRYFATVVEEGTVTGAAERLHMTQPPLTAQLHLLEKELGCSLFLHEGRRLVLTDAGKRFYQRAITILGLCDSVSGEMARFGNGTSGTLRLGVVSSVQGTLFLGWLSQFASLYPQVRYDICNENTYQLLEQLRTGQLDLAFVRTPFPSSDCEMLTLKREPMMAAGLPCHFASLPSDRITLSHLASRPLILYRRWEKVLRSRFESLGYTPDIRCCNDNAQMTLDLAGTGMGIGLIPASALLDLPATSPLVWRTIDDDGLNSEITLVCQRGVQLPQTARLLWQMMEELT